MTGVLVSDNDTAVQAAPLADSIESKSIDPNYSIESKAVDLVDSKPVIPNGIVSNTEEPVEPKPVVSIDSLFPRKDKAVALVRKGMDHSLNDEELEIAARGIYASTFRAMVANTKGGITPEALFGYVLSEVFSYHNQWGGLHESTRQLYQERCDHAKKIQTDGRDTEKYAELIEQIDEKLEKLEPMHSGLDRLARPAYWFGIQKIMSPDWDRAHDQQIFTVREGVSNYSVDQRIKRFQTAYLERWDALPKFLPQTPEEKAENKPKKENPDLRRGEMGDYMIANLRKVLQN